MPINITFSDNIVRVAVELNGGIESLITELPQREWVGLTDEDWDEIFGNSLTIGAAIKNTEAKLKQKNGYAEEKNT